MTNAPVVLAKEDLTQLINLRVSTAVWTAKMGQRAATTNTKVRAADDYAATHLSNVHTVDTSDLARVSDYALHLSKLAELTLGSRLARTAEPTMP
jgi:hypothetical protein